MRVAVYHNLPSGGAKKALFYMLKGLSKEHEIHLFSLNEEHEDLWPLSKFSTHSKYYNFTPVKKPYDKLLWPFELFNLNKVQKYIAQEIDGGNFDLVFVANCQVTQSPLILNHLKTKSIFYSQEPRRSSYKFLMTRTEGRLKSMINLPRNSVLKFLDAKAIRNADTVLSNSIYSQSTFKRAYGINTRVCYLGIDTQIFAPSSLDKLNYIVCVGAIEPFKNQLRVVKALLEMSMNDRPTLKLVYDRANPNYKKEIEDLVAQYNLNVEFLNRVSEKELSVIYSRAKATICVAQLEPFGFTPLESLAAGTPVIAQDEGGYKETIANEYSILLKSKRSSEIAVAINSIMTRKYDRKQMHTYVKSNWSWGETVNKLNKIFSDETAPTN